LNVLDEGEGKVIERGGRNGQVQEVGLGYQSIMTGNQKRRGWHSDES